MAPSTQTPSTPASLGRLDRAATWAVLLVVFLLVFPLVDHTGDGTHDFGSQAAIEYWLRAGMAFGTDIVQNVGPYGYVSYPKIYTGMMDLEKLFLNVALTALFVGLFWNATKGKTAAFRAAALLLIALLAVEDAFFYVLFLLIAHDLLCEPRRYFCYVLMATVALLSLAKGTFFVLGGITVTVVAVNEIAGRRQWQAARIVLCYLASFVILWSLAGQGLAAIPGFITAVLGFSQGYNNAMQIYEPLQARYCGVALVFLMTGILAARAGMAGHRAADRRGQRLFCLVQLLMLFVVWKHGYVRGDQHVLIFVEYVGIAAFLTIWSLGSPLRLAWPATGTDTDRQRFLLAAIVSVAIPALIWLDIASLNPRAPQYLIATRVIDLGNKIKALADPLGYVAELRSRLAAKQATQRFQMADFRAIVGSTRLGYMGIYPGVMVYGDVNYMPMPSTISFATWSGAATRADARFLADPRRAPHFVLVDPFTIDNRFLPLDDSLAKLELLHRYTPVLGSHGWTLFTRNPESGPVTFTPLASQTAAVGDWISVPDSAQPLWVALHVDQGLAAHLVGALYKPAEYLIDYQTSDNMQTRQRLVLTMAETGMLLNPLITTNDELIEASAGANERGFVGGKPDAHRRLRAFRVVCGQLDSVCGHDITVQFSTLGGLGLNATR